MNGHIAYHKRQSIEQFKAFLAQGALLAQTGNAQSRLVDQLKRHARLQTTQDYLHMQQVTLSREAADLLDNAAAKPRGKRVAKRANAR